MSNSTVVLLEGSKCYWKTRNTLDIIVVEHTRLDILEVIAYEPSFDAEAPRLYLNNKVVRSRVDTKVIDRYLRSAKIAAQQSGKVPDVAASVKTAEGRARAEYILARLFIKDFSYEERRIVVEMQFDFNDRDDEHGGLDVSTMVIQPPADLQPYEATKYHTIL
jgi:hypothetical protein